MIEEVQKAPESATRLPSEKATDGRKRFLRRTLANLATATRKGQ